MKCGAELGLLPRFPLYLSWTSEHHLNFVHSGIYGNQSFYLEEETGFLWPVKSSASSLVPQRSLIDEGLTLLSLQQLHKDTGGKAQLNKDHQRMMVDPMFMIVQSLRSFLTAVKTTAVAPIAVIFTCVYLNIPKIT